jgi:hypothetical protein
MYELIFRLFKAIYEFFKVYKVFYKCFRSKWVENKFLDQKTETTYFSATILDRIKDDVGNTSLFFLNGVDGIFK